MEANRAKRAIDIEFAVVRDADGWRVISSNQKFGRYAFKVDAEEIALKLAERSRAAGSPSEVLVQGEFGELRVINPPPARPA